MRILLLTQSKVCITGFGALSRSRKHSLEIHPTARMKHVVSKASPRDFVYLDVAEFTLVAARARIRTLTELIGARFGIVDSQGLFEDVAEVFHRGASDYVGKRLLKTGVTAARITRLEDFAPVPAELLADPAPQPVPFSNLSGSDWKQIELGTEYAFQMIYVGLDGVREMRRKSSEDLIRNLRRTLQGILTREFADVNARIWLWKEDEGVLLCPFDGENVTALIPAMRLVMNRVLINIERFSVTTPISWRMGIHIGTTVYQDTGKTSGIVSESLNFIFHLGQRSIKTGELVVTQPALSLAGDKIRDCFVQGPDFESVPLSTMRKLL